MKRSAILIALLAAGTCAATAQSAVDMLQVTQPGFRGTARFMGMGGAFTALGGDISSMTQNPAGLGIYRHSEIAATLDIDIQNTKAPGQQGDVTNSKTRVDCNNFGYVGTVRLDNDVMPFFNWGVSYNRLGSFDRVTTAYAIPTQTSLTNYIASYTGYPEETLNFGKDYNPYSQSDADWLSILAYNSYLINPRPDYTEKNPLYGGLFQNGTEGDAAISVRERGYTDQYNINFAGNIQDVVFWGLGFGITDMSYRRDAYYSESMAGATAYNKAAGGVIYDANAGFDLNNYKRIWGSGWNMNFGLIVKPVNELRLGIAVATPTWWKLDHEYQGIVDYSYYAPSLAESQDNPTKGSQDTDFASFSWRLRSPWRLMAGVSAVLGGKAIISFDYERQAYNDMKIKTGVYDKYGYVYDYQENPGINGDVKNYYQAANVFRIGAEFRVTPAFSVRAGYNTTTTNVKDEYKDGGGEVLTAGTDPSFAFNKKNENFCVGLGYKFGSVYLDGAYVYNHRTSNLFAYTDSAAGDAPKWNVSDNNSSIVLTAGFRF